MGCLPWLGELAGGSGELGDRTAGPLDLRRGRGRERVRGHPQGHVDLAGAEYLDQLALAGRALGDLVLRSHVAALGEQLGQPAGVHHLVAGAETRVGEALQLWYPALQRHLAALEAETDLVAGLGALGAAPRRLALGRLTAADPRLGLVRSRGRPQVVQLQAPSGGTLFVRHFSPLP